MQVHGRHGCHSHIPHTGPAGPRARAFTAHGRHTYAQYLKVHVVRRKFVSHELGSILNMETFTPLVLRLRKKDFVCSAQFLVEVTGSGGVPLVGLA